MTQQETWICFFSRWHIAVVITMVLISDTKEVIDGDCEVNTEIIGIWLSELLYGSIQESDLNESGE
jgi:hypothetical protein